jgi:hypothetical protein
VQQRLGFLDPVLQRRVDEGAVPYDHARTISDFTFRGGCTLIIDPDQGVTRYCIAKSIVNQERLERARRYCQYQLGDDSAGA